jgi:hypothetical protein
MMTPKELEEVAWIEFNVSWRRLNILIKLLNSAQVSTLFRHFFYSHVQAYGIRAMLAQKRMQIAIVPPFEGRNVQN